MSPVGAKREGPYALHLDTHPSYGFVKKVSGGSPRANTAVQGGLRDNTIRKRPVSRSYEDFHVEAGMGAPPISTLCWILMALR